MLSLVVLYSILSLWSFEHGRWIKKDQKISFDKRRPEDLDALKWLVCIPLTYFPRSSQCRLLFPFSDSIIGFIASPFFTRSGNAVVTQFCTGKVLGPCNRICKSLLESSVKGYYFLHHSNENSVAKIIKLNINLVRKIQ